MANRSELKIVSKKYRKHSSSLEPSSISLDKIENKPISTQDAISRFIKNINYEYLRKEFTHVKEKFKRGNRSLVLANPYSEISNKMPIYMKKIAPRIQKPKPSGGFKVFILKSLIGALTVYSTIKLGVWGTADDTSALMSQISSLLRGEGKFPKLVSDEYAEKYSNVFASMSNYAKGLSESTAKITKDSAEYLKSLFRKKE